MSNKIVIKYDDDFTPGSGTITTITFGNEDLRRALRKVFACTTHERITGLVIDERGISAHFKRDEGGYVTSSKKTGG